MKESEQKHPINVVSKITGLSTHVIRAWENRYGAVSPGRTPGNHRLYSDGDVQRLLALKHAIKSGWKIGRISSLPTHELLEITVKDGLAFPGQVKAEPPDMRIHEAESSVLACLDAVKRFDAAALWEALYRSSVLLGRIGVIEDVIIPLMRSIGEQWSKGSVRIVHEHAASAVIRTYLGDQIRSLDVTESAPRAVTCTPEGELHEMGALAAAVGAAVQGWRVQYLGPNLPWEEIAGSVEIFKADLVLVSVIMGSGEGRDAEELKKLRSFIPRDVSIIVGGTLSPVGIKDLAGEGIEYLDDIRSLRARLSGPREETAAGPVKRQ